jgi:thioredoxin reductase
VEKDGHFRLTDATGNAFTCRRLIVATGFAKPWVPDIPGIELADNYADVSLDKAEFTNRRVLILGKGASAFETAEHLIDAAAILHVASPNPLQSSWKSPFVGHLRAASNGLLDSYLLKNLNAILDCRVESIERSAGRYLVAVRWTHAQGEAERLVYDRVIVCTGFRFDDSVFAPDCRPELVRHGRFPAQTGEWESTNVHSLYFAGTLSQAGDDQMTTSGSIHGFRHNVRALHRMLERKYHGRNWPVRQVEPTPDGLAEAVLARLNGSSALWQQPGFLHDVIAVSDDWDLASYYEEMPMAYVQASPLGQHRHYYTVALELGKAAGDPFSVVRHPTPEQAGALLHPVIRRWRGRELLGEQHLVEELYGEWRKPEVHDAALRGFFRDQLLSSRPAEEVTAEDLLLAG